jgi:hypothetical protein
MPGSGADLTRKDPLAPEALRVELIRRRMLAVIPAALNAVLGAARAQVARRQRLLGEAVLQQ